MRKVIAAIIMTIDGFCDHTAGIPDIRTRTWGRKILHPCVLYPQTDIKYKILTENK
jgi:hypothetical protein